MAAGTVVRFTVPELRHLLYLVQSNADSGVYWGNQEQFYARQIHILETLKEALEEKSK